MNNTIKKTKMYVAAIAIVVLASCKASKFDVVEPQKDISGDWQVKRVLQNSIDITKELDLTAFRINFNKNGYSLINSMPFIVSKDGTWSFNDPTYPFAVTFTPANGNPVKSELIYSVQQGQRTMKISFNTGCDQNAYEYLLSPAN